MRGASSLNVVQSRLFSFLICSESEQGRKAISCVHLAGVDSAGLLGLFIADKLPVAIRLPFYLSLIAGIIWYRLVGAEQLRKFIGRSKRQ